MKTRDLNGVCTVIHHQSTQTPTDIRLHQLDGMLELAGYMSEAKLPFPAILFGFIQYEHDRLKGSQDNGRRT